jgi:hypothetical protein
MGCTAVTTRANKEFICKLLMRKPFGKCLHEKEINEHKIYVDVGVLESNAMCICSYISFQKRILVNIQDHLPAKTEQNHENLNQNSRCPGRDQNLGPLEYESELLAVSLFLNFYHFVLFLYPLHS